MPDSKHFVLYFLISALLLTAGKTYAGTDSLSLAEAIRWLENESHHLIRASRRTMKDSTSAFPPQVGIGYEAFWLRDYVYTLEGSIDSYSDRELLDASRIFIKSAIDKILREHERIGEYFFTETAKSLQNLDSEIMAGIQQKFLEMNIPVLCIHDSCIAARQHENLLNQVMKEVYVEHLGFEPVLEWAHR